MFETLIESQRKPDNKRFLRVGFVSLTIHTALIAAAIIATVKVSQGGTKVRADTTLVILPDPLPPADPTRPWDRLIYCHCVLVTPPTDTLTDIPRIDLWDKFGDQKDRSGSRVEDGAANGGDRTGEWYPESLVDVRPSVLSAPQPLYPELLRQAGIGGRVLIEAIIDTSGRAEQNSVRIIESPNPGFDPGSRNWMLHAQFRPARVYGHAVRVLIRVPLDYRITGR